MDTKKSTLEEITKKSNKVVEVLNLDNREPANHSRGSNLRTTFGKNMKTITLSLTLFGLIVFSLAAAETKLSERIIPTLSITAAIELAERYILENNIDLTNKFLSSVKYHESGAWTKANPRLRTSGPYWQITYEVNTRVNGGQVFILVYMDGKIRHVGGM